MKALVYGDGGGLMEAIPSLLNRAGFLVDVITIDKRFTKLKHAHSVMIVPTVNDIVEELLGEARSDYQLYIPTDDQILSVINASSLSTEKKVALLAVTSKANLAHIYSKIGLAKILEEHHICSPKYSVAFNKKEIFQGAHTIQFPVIVKINSSNGGIGTYECRSDADIEKLPELTFPVLIQEKIEGDLIDLSGFYQCGKLVHFSYSEFLTLKDSVFGLSSVRKYTQREYLNPSISKALSELGAVIGANGFVNTTCIKNHVDGKFYFIEADMRPNVWVEHSRYFGDDPAVYIRNYFEKGEFLPGNTSAKECAVKKEMILAYLPRLDSVSIVFNRYNCWKHYENYLKIPYIRQHFFGLVIAFAVENIKPRIPKCMWACLRRVPLSNFAAIPVR